MELKSKSSSKDMVYEYVKDKIILSTEVTGEFITEGDIAEELGVSWTPVREAFLRLEAEHLLQLVPRRGAFIVPMSARELEEVMETRSIIEIFSAEKVIEARIDVADRLEAQIEDQRRQIAENEARRFIDADREFHITFVGAVENQVLLELYNSLRDRQLRMGIAAVAGSTDRMEEVITEHAVIRDAAAEYDIVALKDAIRDHLTTTLEVLMRCLSRTSDLGRSAS